MPLAASFQDHANLYLVMDYMPGGDFLNLLIRENTLHEGIAQFYVAEMILAVEETHRLKFIHRDIKPDNFLISASGHLKISDFGLAFDGHWSHDASFYNWHRHSLVRKLQVPLVGDERDISESQTIKGQLERAKAVMAEAERYDRGEHVRDHDLRPLVGWRDQYGYHATAKSIVGTSQYMAPEVIAGTGYDGRCD